MNKLKVFIFLKRLPYWVKFLIGLIISLSPWLIIYTFVKILK